MCWASVPGLIITTTLEEAEAFSSWEICKHFYPSRNHIKMEITFFGMSWYTTVEITFLKKFHFPILKNLLHKSVFAKQFLLLLHTHLSTGRGKKVDKLLYLFSFSFLMLNWSFSLRFRFVCYNFNSSKIKYSRFSRSSIWLFKCCSGAFIAPAVAAVRGRSSLLSNVSKKQQL